MDRQFVAGSARLLRLAVINQGMTLPNNPPLDIETLAKDLRAGSHAALARAITLIESRRSDHQAAAADLPDRARPQGRCARGGSLLGAHRRLDPRRQDADGAARRLRARLYPALA